MTVKHTADVLDLLHCEHIAHLKDPKERASKTSWHASEMSVLSEVWKLEWLLNDKVAPTNPPPCWKWFTKEQQKYTYDRADI